MIRFLFASLVFCSVCQAEITVTVTQQPVKAVWVLKQTLKTVSGEVVSFTVEKPAGEYNVPTVKIISPSKFVLLSAKRLAIVNGEVVTTSATVKEIGTREYSLAGPAGKYTGLIIASDPTNPIELKEFDVVIEEAKIVDPDDPKPPPKPDVEIANEFNVGKIAYANAPANDAAMAKQIASWYRAGASKLFGVGGLSDIETIKNEIYGQFARKQCKDKETCEQWDRWKTAVSSAMRAEQVRRKTFTKQEHFSMMIELAEALEKLK